MMSISKDHKIVITGAEGFIGKNLSKALQEYNIWKFDRSVNSFFDIDSMKELINDVDMIYHFAGVNSGSGFQPTIQELNQNNVDATFNLVKAIEKFTKVPPLLVTLSSIHVYDKTKTLFQEDQEPVPSSTYGISKLTQEVIINKASKMKILRPLIFRASNIYGPGSKPNYNSALATFCNQVINGEMIPLYANGNATMDLIYVDDVVRALMNAPHFEKSNHSTFNLASGEIIKISELIHILGEISGIEIKTRKIDSDMVNFNICKKRFDSVLSNFKLTDIKEGVRSTYEQI